MIFYKGGIAKDRESIRNLRNAQATSLQAAANTRSQNNAQKSLNLLKNSHEQVIQSATNEIIPVLEELKRLSNIKPPKGNEESHEQKIQAANGRVDQLISVIDQFTNRSAMMAVQSFGAVGENVGQSMLSSTNTLKTDIDRFRTSPDPRFTTSGEERASMKLQQKTFVTEEAKQRGKYSGMVEAAIPSASPQEKQKYIQVLQKRESRVANTLDPNNIAVQSWLKLVDQADKIVGNPAIFNLRTMVEILKNPNFKSGIVTTALVNLQNIAQTFGVKLEDTVLKGIASDLTSIETFDKLRNQLVIAAFEYVKGNLNTKEVALLEGSQPKPTDTVETNIETISAILAITQMKQEELAASMQLAGKDNLTEKDIANYMTRRINQKFRDDEVNAYFDIKNSIKQDILTARENPGGRSALVVPPPNAANANNVSNNSGIPVNVNAAGKGVIEWTPQNTNSPPPNTNSPPR